MEDLVLKKVQMAQLSIAKEIKRICEKYDIEYFLDSGTLLGAVRHKGFIPWDDDMDFGMTRDNYNRFVNIAQEELGNKYFLQTWKTDKNFPMPYAKIRLCGTQFIENVFEKAEMNQGIYVDILPYDNWPVKHSKQKKLYHNRLFIQSMIMMKCHFVKFKSNAAWKYLLKSIMFTFIKFFSLFRTKKSLVQQYEKMTERLGALESNSLYEQTVNSKFAYWVLPKECFGEYIDLDFEGENFKCPKDYDSYLKIAYGDYMTPPPEEKRKLGHQIIKVDFGKYEEEFTNKINN